MKKLIISGIFTLFLTYSSYSQLDTVYFDSYNDNRTGWVSDTEENASKIENGNYVWTRKKAGEWATWWEIGGINAGEFLLETRFRIEGDGAFGFLWGSKDIDNSNYFVVSNAGIARSYIESRNNTSVIKENIPVKNFNSDFNTLTISKKDNKVTYLVNGEAIHEDYYNGLYGINFGFSFQGISKYYIDYFLVKHRINLVPGIKYTGMPENLGYNVNTRSSEICPIVTPDGQGIFFIRVEDPENTGGTADYSDIYYAKTGPDKKWQLAFNMKKPLNNKSTNSVNSVTPDGNTLFLLHTYNEDGTFKSNGLSISNRSGSSWEMPKDITVIDHYNLNEYNEFCMSNDKRIIVMAVEREETFGQKDLYVSFNIDGQLWSTPLNLGPVVNSKMGEISPFLAADNTTLYFSSDGHPGYGNNDIFLTRRLDDSWTNWSKPENLGKPINTNNWDAYYSVPASGEYAYFVSSKSGYGSSDIFRIKLPEMARPNPVVLVKGKVLNQKTKTPLQAVINYFDLQNAAISGTAMSNPETGNYQITLPAGRLYGFLASSDKFISVNENIDLKELGEYKELERDLYLVPIEIGEKVRLNNIFFETGKWDLLPESFSELDKLVRMLADNPSMEIEINGHTDNVGNDESNLVLSQKRAAAVVTYLLEKGIASTRLDSAGFGETQPVAPNDTDEGRALNRRVEFMIVKM
jgi:outer membrane protein OmpA-like peptidoglycan-associated protein